MGRRAKIKSKKRNRRIILIAVAAVVVIAIIAFAFLVESTFTTPYATYIYQPVPQSLYQEITTVSDSTLAAIGSVSSVAAPSVISGAELTLNAKPEIVYVGAEYCPYCAVERWALIVALSRFGNFTGLEYMVSSSTDVNANTPTFTFSGANFSYSSQYVAFVPTEIFNRTNEATTWHTLSATESSVYSQYGSGGFPFVDFANEYLVNGVQSTIDLGGQNWTQVASQLNNPQSTTAQQIDGAANKLISVICKIDGGLPDSVCTQTYADTLAAYTPGVGGSPSATSLTPFMVAPASEASRWIG